MHAGTRPSLGRAARYSSPCAAPMRRDIRRLCRPVVGRLLAPTDDPLMIEDAHGLTRRIDLATGTRVERSAGYRRHTWLGLGLGSLAGVGVGSLLYSGCTTGGEDDGLCGFYYFGTVPAGAALGTLSAADAHRALGGSLVARDHATRIAAPRPSHGCAHHPVLTREVTQRSRPITTIGHPLPGDSDAATAATGGARGTQYTWVRRGLASASPARPRSLASAATGPSLVERSNAALAQRGDRG